MNKSRKDALIYTIFVALIVFFVYGLVCFILRSKVTSPFERGDYRSYFANTKIKVIVYGTSWCRSCAMTRDYLKNRNVSFIEYDIDSVVAAKMQFLQLGGKAVPLLLIGDRRLEGFNAKAIADALSQLPQSEAAYISK